MSRRRLASVDFADTPGGSGEDVPGGEGEPVFRAARDGGGVARKPADLRPGDLLVVPADYGGCDQFGWRPDSRAAVSDVAEFAAWPYRASRYTVRLTLARLEAAMLAEGGLDHEGDQDEFAQRLEVRRTAQARWGALADQMNVLASDAEGQVRAILAMQLPAALKLLVAPLLHARRGRGRRLEVLTPYADDRAENPYAAGVVIAARFGLTSDATLEPGAGETAEAAHVLAAGVPATEDDAVGSLDRTELDLLTHSEDVRSKAVTFARACGLSDPVVADIALAGWFHDAGKADPRFQALLGTGDPLLLAEEAVLAKSGRRSVPGDLDGTGLPPRWRHEALSVRLALCNARLATAHDPGLVLWLIGTHHGWGRPFFPHTDPLDAVGHPLPTLDGLTVPLLAGQGPQSLGFSLDLASLPEDLCGLDWTQLFTLLRHRYGAWGLAHLEAIVRLADHRASEDADRGVAEAAEGAA